MNFEEYVQVRSAALLRLAYLLTAGQQAEAEDLLQSTLLNTYRHWRRVSRSDDVDAYVRRVMVNTHTSSRRLRSAAELPIAQVMETPSQRDLADDVSARQDTWTLLRTLPPRTRAALVLRYYEDLHDAAIGDALGISASSVRASISRGLATLRAQTTSTTGRGA